MNAMIYKNYTARIEYSAEDDCFIGHIAGINDVVGFHGNTVAELHGAFKEAVEDYIATCKKIGKMPQKPYSGKVMLRFPPELHAKAATLAEASGKSLNAWMTDLLAQVSQNVKEPLAAKKKAFQKERFHQSASKTPSKKRAAG
jgi:predicted HicB family RNase H-like nuclease